MSAQNTSQRILVSDESNEKALALVKKDLLRRLAKHGPLSYISNHEALGILREECVEHELAVISNDNIEVIKELSDIAVAAIFAIASKREYNPEGFDEVFPVD